MAASHFSKRKDRGNLPFSKEMTLVFTLFRPKASLRKHQLIFSCFLKFFFIWFSGIRGIFHVNLTGPLYLWTKSSEGLSLVWYRVIRVRCNICFPNLLINTCLSMLSRLPVYLFLSFLLSVCYFILPIVTEEGWIFLLPAVFHSLNSFFPILGKFQGFFSNILPYTFTQCHHKCIRVHKCVCKHM